MAFHSPPIVVVFAYLILAVISPCLGSVLYTQDFSSEPLDWVFNCTNFYWDAANERLAITSVPDYSGNAHVHVPAPQGSFRVSWTLGVTSFEFVGGVLPALTNHPTRDRVNLPLLPDHDFVWMGLTSSSSDGNNTNMAILRDGGDEAVSHRVKWLDFVGKVYHFVTEYDADLSTVTQTVSENGTVIGSWTDTMSAAGTDMEYIDITGARTITGWLDDIRLEQLSQSAVIPEPSSVVVWSMIALLAIAGWRNRRKAR